MCVCVWYKIEGMSLCHHDNALQYTTHNEPKDDREQEASDKPLPRLLRGELDQTVAAKEKPWRKEWRGVGRGRSEGGRRELAIGKDADQENLRSTVLLRVL